MSRVLRFVFRGLIVVVALVGAVGVLFGYFVYSPAPEVPRLSGTLTQGTIEVGGRTRTYLTYVPLGLTKGAPLVVVMHGSGQNGAQTRKWTGYGFSWRCNCAIGSGITALLMRFALGRSSAAQRT